MGRRIPVLMLLASVACTGAQLVPPGAPAGNVPAPASGSDERTATGSDAVPPGTPPAPPPGTPPATLPGTPPPTTAVPPRSAGTMPPPTPTQRPPGDASRGDSELIALPGMPIVTGAPLALTVVYPVADQRIAARDSNFILGSVGSGDATLEINGVAVEVKSNGAYLAWLPVPPGAAPRYRLVARRGSDSAVLIHPVRTFRSPGVAATPAPAVLRPLTPTPVALGRLPRTASDTDRVVNVRPVANGTYKWFAVPGTVVERTGTIAGFTRIRLDSSLEAFVADGDVVELPEGPSRQLPLRTVGNLVVAPDTEWTDVVFPLGSPPPYLVELEQGKLVVTLYSTRATTDLISFRPGESFVRTVTWEPVTNDRVRYTIHLRGDPFGYLAFQDGNAFRVRVRHPPAVRADRPLQGIVIAVDAGHPPVGSTGPTGLYEGDATLGISRALQVELERRGATVLMTRTTPEAVELMARPILARRANAHALVSIHLNAVPDGVNPWRAHGTGTYFFHPQSEPLAREVQTGMVEAMGLRDLGVYFNNLAVVRATWMPAVLCEGAFAIIPEQEAAMRDPQGQRAYAWGVANGLERYFRSLAVPQ